MRRQRFHFKPIRFARNERGGTLAELAILVPFLILMIAAVAELGRLFQTYDTLAKTTRASARYLSNVAYDEPDIVRAKNVALCGKTDCTGVDPVVSGLTLDQITVAREGDSGNPITVTVSITGYSFQPIFNLATMLHADRFAALPVSPSTTMYYMWVDPAGAKE